MGSDVNHLGVERAFLAHDGKDHAALDLRADLLIVR